MKSSRKLAKNSVKIAIENWPKFDSSYMKNLENSEKMTPEMFDQLIDNRSNHIIELI